MLLQIGWVGGRAGRLRRVVVPGGSCSQRDGAAVGGDGDADPAAVSGFSGCCSPYAHPFVLSCAACCATTSHCCSPCSLFPILFRAACCATTLTQSSSRRWRAACPLPTTWSESWTISCCFACWWVWQACDLTRMAMFCMLVGVASLRSDAHGYVLHAGGCGKPAIRRTWLCFACWWVWQACDLTHMAMCCACRPPELMLPCRSHASRQVFDPSLQPAPSSPLHGAGRKRLPAAAADGGHQRGWVGRTDGRARLLRCAAQAVPACMHARGGLQAASLLHACHSTLLFSTCALPCRLPGRHVCPLQADAAGAGRVPDARGGAEPDAPGSLHGGAGRGGGGRAAGPRRGGRARAPGCACLPPTLLLWFATFGRTDASVCAVGDWHVGC